MIEPGNLWATVLVQLDSTFQVWNLSGRRVKFCQGIRRPAG